MDNYQYPLFFEAKDLTDREKEKLRRHFQKKRDSGGGECGMIEKVGDNTYKICFMQKEDQERVLNRKFHTVSLPRGELCLTVTRTNMPQNPQLTDQQSTSQQQTFTKVNTKELEKVYPLEIYLLYYLRDSPKVFKVLQKQLKAISCTIQLNPEEEEAVVSGSAEKGPSGASDAAATWELQVDRTVVGFIENYLCYHVFEPEKVKILLQDFSSMTEDIRVYKDEGYVVVVGEVQVVREKMAILEKNLPIKKECSAPEKQFNLVEEEFSREITACCPNVKIFRGKPNTIILEGPEKEVQLFSTKLDELIKRVKEKRVPLPTVLLNFITSSGAISKYKARFKQSLRSPVALETGSDLVLSSLSSDALEEAAAAVQRDLCMDTIQLEGTLAVAPDLDRVKEVLTKAKNEANCAGLRVEVNFNPAASATPKIQVQLVGYSADVGKLKAVLTDYQLNQAEVQQQLNLQLPEIVDSFDEILALIGMKRPTVKLTASHSPNPCVFLSGPRSRVQETHQALQATLSTLVWDNLVLDGPGAQQYFQKDGKRSMELVESSCQVLIREQQGGSMSSQNTATAPNLNTRQRNSSIPSQSNTASASTSRWRCNTTSSTGTNVPGNKIILEIKIGNLEDVQVDVLVVPIIKAQLRSTNIGISLLNKAGNTLKSTFDVMMGGRNFTPGDVLQVDGPRSLSCSKIFFIECLPWDGARAQSAKTLGTGLRKCLDLCGQQGWVSVALPIIGPGLALNYPLREAVEVLTHTIGQFGRSGSTGSLSTIHIVIKPGYPDSEDCYHDVYSHLSVVMSQGGQAIFQSLNSDLDDVILSVGGGVTLQLVFGDITNETTDVVVNTTDFTDFESDGVCKDILTMAGPQVKAALQSAHVKKGEIFVSQSGQFPCKAIFHVCGQKDAGIIEGLVRDIITSCEAKGYKSVAIPAICAGIGGLEPSAVANAILSSISATVLSTPLRCLSHIRLVLIKINVFLAFKEAARQIFPRALSHTVSAPQAPQAPQAPLYQTPVSVITRPSSLFTPRSTRQQSAFLILGLCKKDVACAIMELERLYQTQCLKQNFPKKELEDLSQENIDNLTHLIEMLGLCVEENRDTWTVSGLNDEVTQVMQMYHACLHGSLQREMRSREEEEVFGRVAWCILGLRGDWERLPRAAHHDLEKKDVRGGIVDAHGDQWDVNLAKMEAVAVARRQTTQLKRLENLADFPLPLYWDNMVPGEHVKIVQLQSSSAEYKRVKQAFKRTVFKTVIKIERLQNIHLRRGYEVEHKKISDKNRQRRDAGEKLLYHGTTEENCQSIITTGFNRSFAGQNATVYGVGTYFAVNASYSADPTYSKPATDGTQLMFVARVLTGLYALGEREMKVPPPRDPQHPHDRFDSVVDNVQKPSMFVVFHDNQAYPDYLITFK
ncbi:protein mono-ADP-ribosyltransferase PARP14-like [Myripristis murdjan]|uniref:protein mono-ADP-ribosyltransferase PARP14-like n=1 Tax=Myripristis murdjan TaxID=586833 RepID=UPI0011762CCD|nr:protein mono-ADP-ribosyltransferase PARP14-like [Myripristis murdjan]